MFGERLGAIRAKLDEPAAEDRGFAVFGSGTHRYRFEPTLSEDELTAFEAEHGALAADYRAFIQTVANGVAGPGHGLIPLAPPRDEGIYLSHGGCGCYAALTPSAEVWVMDGDHRFQPFSPSFLDWYEAWGDRATLDWAHAQMVADMRAGDRRNPRLLELTAESSGGHNRGEVSARLAYRALYAGDVDGARALFEQAGARSPRSKSKLPPPSYSVGMCDLYRVVGDLESRLEVASAGASFWGARKRLLWEKADALFALDRADEAVDALVERARCRDLDALADAVVALRDRGRDSEADELIDQACARPRGPWRRRPIAELRAEIERLISCARSTS